MKLEISPDLEACLLYAVSHGHLPVSALKDDELSKEGRWAAAAIRYLSKKHEPPYAYGSILVTATEILGGDADLLKPFLAKVRDAGSGREVEDLLRAIRSKQTLVQVISAAGEQLAKGEIDGAAITGLLDQAASVTHLTSLSDFAANGLPDLPSGVKIRSLPRLDKASGGLFGLWVMGGSAGAGKSTLALQLALEYGREHSVLYYDFEQGEEALLAHLGLAFNGDIGRVKYLTRNIYVRDTIKTFNEDLQKFKPPTMLIFDSVQSLPTNVSHRREGLDVWVNKFNGLKRKGYCVLLVSELNRSHYGEAHQAGFKETSELEYKADFGIQLMPIDNTSDVEVHCVKNRHRPYKGHLFDLYRRKSWLFTDEYRKGGR